MAQASRCQASVDRVRSLAQRAIDRFDVPKVEAHRAADLAAWRAVVPPCEPQESISLVFGEPEGDRSAERRRVV
jgi:hypothetical protein